MKKIIFLFGLIPFSIFACIAQTNTNPINTPEIVQTPPEAAGITRYGDIPVSAYTGIPDISIPLYTARSGKLKLPITLSYHATGIQVSQEASWVGLGWDLMAGGCISYVPVGGNDQLYLPLTNWSEWKQLFSYVTNGVNQPDTSFEHGYRLWDCTPFNLEVLPNELSQTKDQILEAAMGGQGEQDLYSANFLGYSFKFILLPRYESSNAQFQNRIPIFVGNKNKFKIEPLNNLKFKITGEDGTIYYFLAEETAGSGLSIYTSWYLTDIISPEYERIRLTYSNESIGLIPPLSERYHTGVPSFGGIDRVITSLYSSVNNKCLDSIITDTEIIKLITSGREDIAGARKLEKIKIIDRFTNEEKKVFKFNYDYFEGTTTGGNYLDDDTFWGNHYGSYNENLLSKRLKLLSLSVTDPDDNEGEDYSFTYNVTESLPYKTSFSRDYWGYYNGQENESDLMPNGASHTIVPNVKPLVIANDIYGYISPTLYEFEGASRGVDSTYLTAGMLKSINYPTGGKTVFEFEPHTFNNYKYLSRASENTVYADKNYNVHDNNNSTSSEPWDTLTVHSTTMVHIYARISGLGGTFSLNQLLNATVSVIGPWGPSPVTRTYQLNPSIDTDFEENNYLKIWDEYIELGPGHYTFTCNFPDELGDLGYGEAPVVGILEYTDYNPALLSSQQPMGGGVRVKSITSYDENNNVVTLKKYTYKNENGSTSGKLLVPINFLRTRIITKGTAYSNPSCIYTQHNAFYLSADSYIPPSCTTTGTNVGYDKVEIESLAGDSANGKEVLYFSNNLPEIFLKEIPLYKDNTYGDLLLRIYLDAVNDTIRKEIYNYSQVEKNDSIYNAIVEDLYVGPTGEMPPSEYFPSGACQCLVWPRFIIGAYPTYNYRNQLDEKVETDFLNGSKISKSTEYSYSLDNYALKEIKTLNSDQKLHYKKYLYPYEYRYQDPWYSDVYNAMISRNIINPVIVAIDSLDNLLLSKYTTKYFYFGDNFQFIAPTKVEYQKTNNPSEIRLEFNKYDNTGKVLQYHKSDNIHISYIYGYNNSLPIIEGKNVSYDILNSAVSGINADMDELLLNIGTMTTAQQKVLWKTFNTSLRDDPSLVDAMLTTYTYDPVFGITSVTDPAGNVTYYEYDSFGRLKLVRDQNNNIIREYKYHYRNQQ